MPPGVWPLGQNPAGAIIISLLSSLLLLLLCVFF